MFSTDEVCEISNRFIINPKKNFWNRILIFFIELSVREADREWSLNSLRSVIAVLQLRIPAEEVDYSRLGQVLIR